jgi:hypothetical protein
MTPAERILREVDSDPACALQSGEAYLQTLGRDDHSERAITLRAMSLASRQAGQLEDSIEFARQAAKTAAAGGHEKLRLLAVLTMTGSLATSGRISDALAIIDATIATADDTELFARFRFQRATLLRDLGRSGEAVSTLESVLADFRKLNDRSSLLLTLNNLGLSLIAQGRLDEAESRLRETIDLAEELGAKARVSSAEHNLGVVEFYRGNIPAALQWLQQHDEHSMELTGSPAPQHVTRSEVLSSVGLYGEAKELATRIAQERLKRGDIEHATNALIVGGEAALAEGDHARAQSLAGQVLELVEAESDLVRYALARRIRDEARLAVEGPSRELLQEVTAIAEELADLGHVMGAGQAFLLAGRIAIAIGAKDAARTSLKRVPAVRSGPVETRLQSHLARALICLEEADRRGAASAVRSGLGLIDEYQAALGASDLRSGIEKQGKELGDVGLRLALESGRPRRILEWLDRTRGRALRHQPVVPSGDDDVTHALSELRRIEADLRKPENRLDRALQRRRRRLQQDVAAADRVRRQTLTVGPGFSIDGLIDVLGDRTLLEVGQHDGRLFAVLVRRGRARLVDLGDEEKVVNEVGHVRFGMRRAARLGRTPDLASLKRLDEMLFVHRDMDGEVIVVPPPTLMAIPWAGLPTLRERSFTVTPSAEMWWRAHQAVPPEGEVLVAGGPDLELAEAEVEAVSKLYPSPTVLAPGAEVEEVRTSLAGARTAHIVSHASFQVENPMFSALRLGDGDLNLYDIERLSKSPGLVVLSACDSGYTETRAGDELVGLASALLNMGTRSVVASIGLVPDSAATAALMVRFHQGLISGLQPAAALAAARAGSWEDPADLVAAASFICVGN